MWSMLAELAVQLAALETRCFAALKCAQNALTVGHPLQSRTPLTEAKLSAQTRD